MTQPVRHALILAAGLGTRLQPLTQVRAKPAIPVAGEPIVRRIARWLAGQGVTELVVNLHHLPHTITKVLGDGTDLDARVRYSWEQPLILGSAGGPARALPIVEADTFLIVNGDTLTNLALDDLVAAHRSHGALVTLALTDNRLPSRYGGAVLEGTRVTGFVPRGDAARESFHFVGVQAVSADVFRALPSDRATNSVGDVYDRLLAEQPGSIRGWVSDAEFHDIGTVADYVATSRAIDPRASSSILWDDVEVGDGADLRDCIVTDGVRVPARTRYAHAILLRGDGGSPVAVPWEEHD